MEEEEKGNRLTLRRCLAYPELGVLIYTIADSCESRTWRLQSYAGSPLVSSVVGLRQGFEIPAQLIKVSI
jgi:hypothetical protein